MYIISCFVLTDRSRVQRLSVFAVSGITTWKTKIRFKKNGGDTAEEEEISACRSWPSVLIYCVVLVTDAAALLPFSSPMSLITELNAAVWALPVVVANNVVYAPGVVNAEGCRGRHIKYLHRT